MVTPISAFLSIKGRNKVLFESAAKHEESGRYSFIAFDPIAELIGDNQHYLFKKNGEEESFFGHHNVSRKRFFFFQFDISEVFTCNLAYGQYKSQDMGTFHAISLIINVFW